MANAATPATTPTTATGPEDFRIVLTEKAAGVIHEAFDAEQVKKDRSFVRVGAHPGGCSGYKYDMDFGDDSQLADNDRIFESQGIRIAVDKTCLSDVLGSLEIDYKTGSMVEQGFVFRQLDSGAQCGCGESFTPVKEQKAR